MDDIKSNLQETDYNHYLSDIASGVLRPSILEAKCLEKLVKEFHFIRTQAVGPLADFLDFITYEYMIRNVIIILKGSSHPDADMDSVVASCHPLGMFNTNTMKLLNLVPDDKSSGPKLSDYMHVFNTILVDTPVGVYFQRYFAELDAALHSDKGSSSGKDRDNHAAVNAFNELPITQLENAVMKLYLDDFHAFCVGLGGETAEVMSALLGARADSIAISIVVNSFDSELNKPDAATEEKRGYMFPNFGILYPHSTKSDSPGTLYKAHNDLDVKTALESIEVFKHMYEEVERSSSDKTGGKSLEDLFYYRNVKMMEVSFMGQFHYGVFYSYFKLKEQEARNLCWIGECILQGQRDKIDKYIPMFGKDLFNYKSLTGKN